MAVARVFCAVEEAGEEHRYAGVYGPGQRSFERRGVRAGEMGRSLATVSNMMEVAALVRARVLAAAPILARDRALAAAPIPAQRPVPAHPRVLAWAGILVRTRVLAAAPIPARSRVLVRARILVRPRLLARDQGGPTPVERRTAGPSRYPSQSDGYRGDRTSSRAGRPATSSDGRGRAPASATRNDARRGAFVSGDDGGRRRRYATGDDRRSRADGRTQRSTGAGWSSGQAPSRAPARRRRFKRTDLVAQRIGCPRTWRRFRPTPADRWARGDAGASHAWARQ